MISEVVARIPLHTLEEGSGSLTLIFLHYFGGSAQEWLDVMSQLSDDFRCIAIDLRGHGDSDSPATGYTVDDMADDILDVVQLNDVEDFVLIGHSMSGKVALALASRQPVGLQSLLLISPSPPLPEPIPDDERQRLLTSHGQRAAAEHTLKNTTEVPVSRAIREQIIADDLRTGKLAWDSWLLAGSKEDISDRMAGVKTPIHIIVGSEDRALPPAVQPRLTLPYLPAATIEICWGAGHLLPWEVPHDLANFIRKKLVLNASK
ncbi:MAG: alpha/beta hydrolase fold protein [Spirosoma sp.]|nr:alpha/beta hydrolase fold protein [Spirosoma sp.]